MHLVLVNRLGGLSLTRKSVVTLTGRPDMTIAVYCEPETRTQQQQLIIKNKLYNFLISRLGQHKILVLISPYAKQILIWH